MKTEKMHSEKTKQHSSDSKYLINLPAFLLFFLLTIPSHGICQQCFPCLRIHLSANRNTLSVNTYLQMSGREYYCEPDPCYFEFKIDFQNCSRETIAVLKGRDACDDEDLWLSGYRIYNNEKYLIERQLVCHAHYYGIIDSVQPNKTYTYFVDPLSSLTWQEIRLKPGLYVLRVYTKRVLLSSNSPSDEYYQESNWVSFLVTE